MSERCPKGCQASWMEGIKHKVSEINKCLEKPRTKVKYLQLLTDCPNFWKYFVSYCEDAKLRYPDGTNALSVFIAEHKREDLKRFI